jgi:hypothetical protein
VAAKLANGFVAIVMVARRKSLLPLLMQEIGTVTNPGDRFATLS